MAATRVVLPLTAVLGLPAGAWGSGCHHDVMLAAALAVSPALFASPLRRVREFDDDIRGSFA